MTIKNNLLGGTDFATPTARIKPTDLNDTNNAIIGEIPFKSTGIQEAEFTGSLTHSSSTYTDVPDTSITVASSGRYLIIGCLTGSTVNPVNTFNPASFNFRVVKNGTQIGKLSGFNSRNGPQGATIFNYNIEELLLNDVIKLQVSASPSGVDLFVNNPVNNTTLKLIKLGDL